MSCINNSWSASSTYIGIHVIKKTRRLCMYHNSHQTDAYKNSQTPPHFFCNIRIHYSFPSRLIQRRNSRGAVAKRPVQSLVSSFCFSPWSIFFLFDTTAQQSGLFQYLTVGLLQPTLDSPASRPTRAIACPANVKLDKRFAHVLRDKEFSRNAAIDRYGRKLARDDN
jgi:hypothetical protein